MPWVIGYPIGCYLITIPGYPEIMIQPSMLISMSSLIAVVLVGIAYLRFRKRIDITWKYALVVGSQLASYDNIAGFLIYSSIV